MRRVKGGFEKLMKIRPDIYNEYKYVASIKGKPYAKKVALNKYSAWFGGKGY